MNKRVLFVTMLLVIFCAGNNIVAQPSSNRNYVIANTVKTPGIYYEQVVNSLPIANNGKAQVISYVDGLGRPLQTVNTQAGTGQKDIISPIEYDAFGREVKKYLPYTDLAGSTGGSYKPDWTSKQPAFYNGQLSGVAADASPYSQTVLEASPLNRPLAQGALGTTWQPNLSNAYDATKKTIQLKYELNKVEDKVRLFTVSGNSISSPGFYNAGEIMINVNVDEHQGVVKEYTDKSGHVVLKRVYITNDSLQTYYIYDNVEQLRAVIQPQGVVEAPGSGSWTPSSSFINFWVFLYRYDERNRMVMKKVPGADSVNLFYDPWDRVALIQDAVQRAANKYLFTKYDALNRAIVTGTYTDSRTHTAIRTALAALTNRFEIVNTGVPEGYTLSSTFPASGSFTLTLLTITHYDSHANLPSWKSGYAFVSEYGLPQYNDFVTGQVVATQTNILGGSNWLRTVNYIDDRYRMIQATGDNAAGGKDRISKVYTWDGKLSQDYQSHTSSFYSTALVVKKTYTYDHADRLLTVTHQVGSQPEVTLVSNTYNELGQPLNKKLHTTASSGQLLQKIDYNYNIRGWLTSINKITSTDPGYEESDLFNMELHYNTTQLNASGDAVPQFNGNISEQIWKGGYDDDQGGYRYTYDKANRFKTGKYALRKTDSGTPTWDYTINYNEYVDSYDRNGNITALRRFFLSWDMVDYLTYNYQGNRLDFVYDESNDTSHLGFNDTQINRTSADYTYDNNGSMTSDRNKGISAVTYNHLNLPVLISVTGKGTIEYAYDAAGNKLTKKVTDQTVTPNRITTYKYAGAFVYKSAYLAGGSVPTVDTLELLMHEEGRLRPKKIDTSAAFTAGNLAYVYDYFLKDHLGNVRAVITTETQSDIYAATMETANAAKENKLFSNINTTTSTKPGGFDSDGNNAKVSRLHGNINTTGNKRLGPTLLLKVMAGDTISLSTYGWYTGAVQPPAGGTPWVIYDMITQMTTAMSGIEGLKNPFFTGSSDSWIYNAMNSFLQDRETNDYSNTRPKAFLNWMVVDDQFRLATISPNHMGAVQVPLITGAMEKQQMVGPANMVIRKNGYLYVYLSNESNQDVFFDNLVVNHKRGPLLEKQDYYPFGLEIAGISSKALKTNYVENKEKTFQGQRFDDELDLDWYQFKWRNYDAQIGRFIEIDPLSDKYVHNSTYAFSENKVIAHIELEGLEAVEVNQTYFQNSEGEWQIGYGTTKEVNNPYNLGDGTLNHFTYYSNNPDGGLKMETLNFYVPNESKTTYSIFACNKPKLPQVMIFGSNNDVNGGNGGKPDYSRSIISMDFKKFKEMFFMISVGLSGPDKSGPMRTTTAKSKSVDFATKIKDYFTRNHQSNNNEEEDNNNNNNKSDAPAKRWVCEFCSTPLNDTNKPTIHRGPFKDVGRKLDSGGMRVDDNNRNMPKEK